MSSVLEQSPISTNITLQELIDRHLSGDIEFAKQGYQAFIKAKVENPFVYSNLASIFFSENKLQEAVLLLRQAIKFNPEYLEAYMKLGSVLALQGKTNLGEAIDCFQRVILLKSDHFMAHFNLGNALASSGQRENAIISYQNVIQIKPDFALAYYNLGNLYFDLHQYPDAEQHFSMAMSHDPSMKGAIGRYWHTRMKMCDWSDHTTMLKALKEAVWEPFDNRHQNEISKIISPFVLLSIFDDMDLHLKASRDYTYAKTMSLKETNPLFDEKTLSIEGPIKIAFLSADYYEHPLAFALAEVFELINKEQFEIHAVSFGGKGKNSRMQKRIQSAFGYFHDVEEKSDQEIAHMIAGLGINIAVDLKGYTSECRPAILASRPAPVQVNYLGYPATMGSNFIDYIIADPYVIPEKGEIHYAEKIAYLPDSYLSYDRKRFLHTDKPSRQECGLPEEAFVFCCFNNSYKILPEIFNTWMALLKETPDSVLWLLENNHWANRNLQTQAELLDVDPARLIFAKPISSEEHLARIQNADLFLDTYPYNAHGTATDALWVGLPIITRSGRSFASRVAGSLLKSMSLEELITNDMESYKALAFELAHDHEKLNMLRHKLKDKRENCVLFNMELYREHLQNIFIHMYESRQNTTFCESFNVADL